MSEEPIFSAAPGEKTEDTRGRAAIFFGVLGRKFWKLMTVNLMFLVFNLPAIIIGLVLSVLIMAFFFPAQANESSSQLLTDLLVGTIPTVMLFMALPVLTTGPSQAGMTYLLRNYIYERPTFTWSDFKDKMKENWKQGTVVSLINLFLLVFLIFDFYLYSHLTSSGNIVLSVANGLLIMVLIIFLMMSLYLYPMMVGYTLKIRDLYRNAFLFAFARFFRNLLVLIISFVLIMGPMMLVTATASPIALGIVYIYYIAMGFSLPGFIINFFINPTIDKYLVRDE